MLMPYVLTHVLTCSQYRSCAGQIIMSANKPKNRYCRVYAQGERTGDDDYQLHCPDRGQLHYGR